MSEFKRSKEKIAASGAILLASLAIAACGDDGNNTISQCPAGYTAESKKLKNMLDAQRKLQNGVAQLRQRMPAVSNAVRISAIDLNNIGAATQVFNERNDWHLDVSQETRVDDPSEAFCHGKEVDETYYSPQAQAAIGALESAGIAVEK